MRWTDPRFFLKEPKSTDGVDDFFALKDELKKEASKAAAEEAAEEAAEAEEAMEEVE